MKQIYPASITGKGFAAGGSVLDHKFGATPPYTLGVEEEDLPRLAVPIANKCAESRESDRQSNTHDTSPFDNECGSSPPMQMKGAQLAG